MKTVVFRLSSFPREPLSKSNFALRRMSWKCHVILTKMEMAFILFVIRYVIRCLNIWKLIRKYQFRLPYFGRKFYSLAVRAERKLLEAWQRLTYAWKWCENRDFRTFFTLSTIVNKNYKTGECQGLKWRTKHGIKKRKKRKGGRKCTPPAKRRVKVQMKNLIFLISRILRICVRRFKGHQNGVEIFPFF